MKDQKKDQKKNQKKGQNEETIVKKEEQICRDQQSVLMNLGDINLDLEHLGGAQETLADTLAEYEVKVSEIGMKDREALFDCTQNYIKKINKIVKDMQKHVESLYLSKFDLDDCKLRTCDQCVINARKAHKNVNKIIVLLQDVIKLIFEVRGLN